MVRWGEFPVKTCLLSWPEQGGPTRWCWLPRASDEGRLLNLGKPNLAGVTGRPTAGLRRFSEIG